MFIKIQYLKEDKKFEGGDTQKAYTVRSTEIIECDAMTKTWGPDGVSDKNLRMQLSKGKNCIRELIFNHETQRCDIFIENNEGKTIEYFSYPLQD